MNTNSIDRAFFDVQVSNVSATDGYVTVAANNTVGLNGILIDLDRRCAAYYIRVLVGGRFANGTIGTYCSKPLLADELYLRNKPKTVSNVT